MLEADIQNDTQYTVTTAIQKNVNYMNPTLVCDDQDAPLSTVSPYAHIVCLASSLHRDKATCFGCLQYASSIVAYQTACIKSVTTCDKHLRKASPHGATESGRHCYGFQSPYSILSWVSLLRSETPTVKYLRKSASPGQIDVDFNMSCHILEQTCEPFHKYSYRPTNDNSTSGLGRRGIR